MFFGLYFLDATVFFEGFTILSITLRVVKKHALQTAKAEQIKPFLPQTAEHQSMRVTKIFL